MHFVLEVRFELVAIASVETLPAGLKLVDWNRLLTPYRVGAYDAVERGEGGGRFRCAVAGEKVIGICATLLWQV